MTHRKPSSYTRGKQTPSCAILIVDSLPRSHRINHCFISECQCDEDHCFARSLTDKLRLLASYLLKLAGLSCPGGKGNAFSQTKGDEDRICVCLFPLFPLFPLYFDVCVRCEIDCKPNDFLGRTAFCVLVSAITRCFSTLFSLGSWDWGFLEGLSHGRFFKTKHEYSAMPKEP